MEKRREARQTSRPQRRGVVDNTMKQAEAANA